MNWHWLAGFFDGEGCIHLGLVGNSIQPKCEISQSERNGGERVVLDIQKFLDEEGITTNKPRKNKLGKKRFDAWELRITSRKNVLLFLQKILPYLSVKRNQALDVIRFLKIFVMKEEVHLMLHSESIRKIRTYPTRYRYTRRHLCDSAQAVANGQPEAQS